MDGVGAVKIVRTMVGMVGGSAVGGQNIWSDSRAYVSHMTTTNLL
jgi:hypothetical protein